MDLLIVEGNKKVRDLVRSILMDIFDTLYECEDGLTVEQKYDLHSPDFVLIDIYTKKVNGLALTKRIMQKHPDAKIILMSNSSDESLKELASQAGALEYILKEDLYRISEIILKQIHQKQNDVNIS